MDFGDIKKYLENDLARVESLIEDSLKSDIKLLDGVNRSILSNGGKRCRPVLSLLSAKICGSLTKDSIRFAAAAELLHNATLLHDDVADESKTRRGKATVMSVLGGRAAVLLGDFWLVKAMKNILRADASGKIVTEAFSKTLGDLAEGELLQLEKSFECDTTADDYFRIIYCKTASLFETAAVSGAISAGADSIKIEAIRNYAVNIGLAFQIKDDIFDYEPSEKLGKPAGMDLKEQKITLPLLCALSDDDNSETIRGKLKDAPANEQYISKIVDYVKERGGIGRAGAILEDYTEKAIRALDIFPDSTGKDCLIAFAEFIARRKN